MYTRFKSQKSGIKLGLNTITNTTRTRVVVPTTNASPSLVNNELGSNTKSKSPISKKSDINNNTNSISSTNNKSDSLLSSSSSSLSSSTSNINLPTMAVSTATVILDSTELSQANQVDTSKNENLLTLPFEDGVTLITKPSFYNPSKKESMTRKESKNNLNNSYNNLDEPIDPTCITYVKSMWEKYASEIGKSDHIVKHVDDSSQYPHLKGFVAFDMEHWWAERSISCMMNEKPSKSDSVSSSLSASSASSPTSSTSSSPSSSILSKYNDTNLNDTYKINSTNKTQFKLMNKIENEFTFNSINKSVNLKLSPMAAIPPSLQSLNNFQICFS